MRIVTNLFIAICVCSWLMMTAGPSPFQTRCINAIEPVSDLLGLTLWFNMFAPEVPKANHAIEADITFIDGSHKTWKFKSMDDYKHNLWLHQVKIRDAALTAWQWRDDGRPELRPTACKFVARLFANPANNPVKIILYDYSTPIPLPDNKGRIQGRPTTRNMLFEYDVQPEDLQ